MPMWTSPTSAGGISFMPIAREFTVVFSLDPYKQIVVRELADGLVNVYLPGSENIYQFGSLEAAGRWLTNHLPPAHAGEQNR